MQRAPSPSLYRAFSGNDRSAILFATPEGVINEANATACRLLGCSRGDLVDRPVADLFAPEDRRVPPALDTWLSLGSFRGELLVRCNGEVITAGVTLARYASGDGSAGMVVALRDAQERPAALGGGEQPLDTWLTDLASDAVLVFDEGGAIKYANRALEATLGHPPGEMIGVVALHLVHPADLQRMVGEFAEAWTTPGVGRPIDFRARHRDGSWVHLEASTNNLLDDPRVRGVVVVVRDISDRAAALQDSEERFRVAFERAAVAMGQIGPDGRWLRVNDRLAELLGRDATDLVGRPVAEVVHPADRGAPLERLLPGGAPPEPASEQRWLRGDGQTIWVDVVVGASEEPADAAPIETRVVLVEPAGPRRQTEQALAALTPRELEVLRLVAEGRTNREIAAALVLSPRTAKFHVENLIRKLGVEDRRAVAERAAELLDRTP